MSHPESTHDVAIETERKLSDHPGTDVRKGDGNTKPAQDGDRANEAAAEQIKPDGR